MQIDRILEVMTPAIYRRFQRAVEIGKWPDGRVLTAQQRGTCMQAMIAFESRHVALHKRTAYLPDTACGGQDADSEVPLNWQE